MLKHAKPSMTKMLFNENAVILGKHHNAIESLKSQMFSAKNKQTNKMELDLKLIIQTKNSE